MSLEQYIRCIFLVGSLSVYSHSEQWVSKVLRSHSDSASSCYEQGYPGPQENGQHGYSARIGLVQGRFLFRPDQSQSRWSLASIPARPIAMFSLSHNLTSNTCQVIQAPRPLLTSLRDEVGFSFKVAQPRSDTQKQDSRRCINSTSAELICVYTRRRCESSR